MNDWYYAVGQQQQGPVSREELVRLLREGQLPPQSLVWNSSMTEWLAAERVPGLIPAAGTLGGFASSSPGPGATEPAPAGWSAPQVAPAGGSSNPYASPMHPSAIRSGPPVLSAKWDGHVKAVSIMLIVAGVLAILGSLACGGFSGLVLSGAIPDIRDRDDEIMASVYLVMSALAFFAGGFVTYAGTRCLKFQGRVLGIIASVLCILSCGLPGMGVGIYGLVILCQGEVARLFDARR